MISYFMVRVYRFRFHLSEVKTKNVTRPSYIPDWLPPERSDSLFVLMRDRLDWRHDTEARAEYFMAHEPTAYTYGSGAGARTYHSCPYHSAVLSLQAWLNNQPPGSSADVGHYVRTTGDTTPWGKILDGYNVCFLNRYDEQKHQLGWHADDTPGMRHDHPIAVVSLGAEREIWWRPNGESGVVPMDQRQLLGHGSLFIMPAGFQLTHQHRIPKADHVVGTRISLTFRRYLPE
jgi:hypothetical protein